MHRSSLTRRQTLGFGAAGLAAASALRPAAALAAPRPTAFALDLTGALEDGGRATTAGWRTLPVARAPRRFDLMGLEYRGGDHVSAQIRARRRGGPWTAWTPLHAAGEHAPDRARPSSGTEPCWTGSADEFQVRLLGRPRRLTARFVRAKPAAAAARRLHARASASAARRRKPSAQGAQVPPIIPRSAWGGDRYPPKADPDYGEVHLAFVHHTVTANDYGPEDSAAIVLGICRYHRDHNGWNDIGYNFLVDRFGQVFEGRAGGVDRAVLGAQAQGYNSVSTGVACLGNYSSTSFADAGAEAVARLLGWKLPLHGVPVTGEVTVTSAGGAANRYPAGRSVTFERISGHRDGNATACPGADLYAQLPAVRERAAALAVAPRDALTIATPTTTVRTGTRIPLSGVLRFADGTSSAGRPLQIQFQTAAGGAWELVGGAVTAADGSWSGAVSAYATGRLRAVFPGDGVHPTLEAPPLTVTVTPDVTLELSRTEVRPGGRVELSGTVSPTWPSRLELKLERHTSRGALPVRRKRVRVRDGRFRTAVRLERKGRYRLTIDAAGTVVRRRLRAR